MIVGFPAEDERAFANTLRTARDAGLTKIHVFPYSPRPGTVTAQDDPVPPQEKKERGARLRAASHDACLARWRTKLGRDDVGARRPARAAATATTTRRGSSPRRAGRRRSSASARAAVSEEGILAA